MGPSLQKAIAGHNRQSVANQGRPTPQLPAHYHQYNPQTQPNGGSTDTGAGLDEDPHIPDKDGVPLPDPKRQKSRASAEDTSDVELGDDPDWGNPKGNT